MDQTTRSTLTRLGAAFALSWASTSMAVGPGSAALVRLSGNLAFAGLYVALFNIGAATGAALGGRAMDRYGRKPPLLAAYLVSAAGYVIAGIGVQRRHLGAQEQQVVRGRGAGRAEADHEHPDVLPALAGGGQGHETTTHAP